MQWTSIKKKRDSSILVNILGSRYSLSPHSMKLIRILTSGGGLVGAPASHLPYLFPGFKKREMAEEEAWKRAL